ncbi:prepilin peptidase, partial [Staphylococcus chromogenes]|uniref:prepilin peptidase n=1 Tax=Staphylococcus chromogenes TaxID=46126 RepID=UPI0015F7B4C1
MSFLLQFSIGDPLSKFSIFTRSKCKQCQKTLQWWMVLPIWSYIFLRGKCHYCQKAIPKYLWVGECLGSVVSFFILSRHFEIYWFYLYFLILVFLSLGLIDIKYFIGPHRLLALLLLLTLVLMPQFLKFSLAKLLLIST